MYRKKITTFKVLFFCIVMIFPFHAVANATKSDSLSKKDSSPVKSSTQKDTDISFKKKSGEPQYENKINLKSISLKKNEQKKDGTKIKFFSTLLIRVAEKVPNLLKTPQIKSKSIILSIKKNSGKLAILFISFVIILATVFFFKQKVEKNRFMTTTRLSVMDKEVQRACRHIEINYYNIDLSVESLCELMVTGKAFLTALFEKELGMTVEEFIMQVRINRAKIMLSKDSGIEPDILALKTGFCGISEFKNAFVKMAGVDVENFRKSLMTEQNVM